MKHWKNGERELINKIKLEVSYYEGDKFLQKHAGTCIISDDLKEVDQLFKIAKKNLKEDLEVG